MERVLIGGPPKFTLDWEIENFAYYSRTIEHISKSPTFRALSLHKSDWYMCIHPSAFDGDDIRLEVNLVKDDLHDRSGRSTFSCEISFLGDKGVTVFSRYVRKHNFALNRRLAFIVGPKREEVFFEKRSLYMPSDTLTVRLHMWKEDDEVSGVMSEHFTLRSAYEVDKAFIMWPIEGFSHLELNQTQKNTFHLPHIGQSFDVRFSLVGSSLEESAVSLRMMVLEGKFHVCCRLYLLNQNTKAIWHSENSFLFGGDFEEDWTICDTLTRRGLLHSGDEFLKFDILCLVLRFVVHSGGPYQHVTSRYYRPADLRTDLSSIWEVEAVQDPVPELNKFQRKAIETGTRRKLVFNSNPFIKNAQRLNYRAYRFKHRTRKPKSGKSKRKSNNSRRDSDSDDWYSVFAGSPQDEPIDYRVPKFSDAIQDDVVDLEVIDSPQNNLDNSPQATTSGTQHSKQTDPQCSEGADPQHPQITNAQHSKISDSQQLPELNGVHNQETEESQSKTDDSQPKSCAPRQRRKLPSPPGRRKRNKSQHKNDATSHLMDNFMSLYMDRFLSDFELRAGDSTFPVHKVVLGARSPVFRTMFSDDPERPGYLVIPDTDAHILNRMLIFLYSSTLEPDLNWEDTAKLYQLAIRFQVQSLKQQCLGVLQSGVTTSNACDVLRHMVDSPDGDEFKAFVLEFVVRHYEKICPSDQWKKLKEFDAKSAHSIERLVQTERKIYKLRPRTSMKNKPNGANIK